MSSSLSVDLRDGYRELARQVGEGVRLDLVRTRDLFNGGRLRRGEALLSAVIADRAGPKTIWGPVLLDLLAPAILDRLQHLKARPPVIDPEDVRQQLIFELLQAAGTMPLPENPCYLRRALMARANQGVRRKLVSERWRQLTQARLEDVTTDARPAPRTRPGAGNQ